MESAESLFGDVLKSFSTASTHNGPARFSAIPLRLPRCVHCATIGSNSAGARYYDVTLSNPGTITLDMNPTIDTLAIVGAQSELVIPAPYTLVVLLGTTLSAGTLRMSGGTIISPEFLMSGGLLTGS